MIMYEDERYIEENKVNKFMYLINRLESYKISCKRLHWNATNRSIHKYLDEFHSILSTFQDQLMESYMGINGQVPFDFFYNVDLNQDVKTDPYIFIEDVIQSVIAIYNEIDTDIKYVGIKSELETFILKIQQYIYLFSLCKKE